MSTILNQPESSFKSIVDISQYYLEKNLAERLPIVYPLFFYTAKKPSTKTLDFFSLYGEHKEFVRERFINPNFINIADSKFADEVPLRGK